MWLGECCSSISESRPSVLEHDFNSSLSTKQTEKERTMLLNEPVKIIQQKAVIRQLFPLVLRRVEVFFNHSIKLGFSTKDWKLIRFITERETAQTSQTPFSTFRSKMSHTYIHQVGEASSRLLEWPIQRIKIYNWNSRFHSLNKSVLNCSKRK